MKRFLPLLMSLAVLLALASCSGSDGNMLESAILQSAPKASADMSDANYYSDTAANGKYSTDASGMYYASEAEFGGLASTSAASRAEYAMTDRKIIKTVDIDAETKEFDRAVAEISTLAAKLGGYIENSSISGNSLYNRGGIVSRNASFVVRIPAQSLDEYTNGIRTSINITNEENRISDVSENYYDTETRITTLKIQEERLLEMLKSSGELQYLIQLEERLSEVRYEIESFQSQLNRYDKQIALSTVNLYLNEVIDYTVVTPTPKTFGERISAAASESWTNFVESCKDLAVGGVYALPGIIVFLLVVLAVVLIIRGMVKRSRKKKAKRYAALAQQQAAAAQQQAAAAQQQPQQPGEDN